MGTQSIQNEPVEIKQPVYTISMHHNSIIIVCLTLLKIYIPMISIGIYIFTYIFNMDIIRGQLQYNKIMTINHISTETTIYEI